MWDIRLLQHLNVINLYISSNISEHNIILFFFISPLIIILWDQRECCICFQMLNGLVPNVVFIFVFVVVGLQLHLSSPNEHELGYCIFIIWG